MPEHRIQSDLNLMDQLGESLLITPDVTISGATSVSGTFAIDTIAERTANAGVTIDGALIKDGRVAGLATASFFLSTEQTGTGSAQNVAHGFGTTPTASIAYFTELDGNAADIAYGTNDATNVVVTVTSGQKFRVLAFK